MKGKNLKKDKRYIIMDTNIISCFSNEEFGGKMIDLLKEVVGYGWALGISDFTYFEILDEAPIDKEVKMINTLNGVPRFHVRKNDLIAAARLGTLYKQEKLPPAQFSPGDKIIAGTSILNNALIMTMNGRDFPQPFFKEIERRKIDYQNKEWPVCVHVYFIEPQTDYVVKSLEKFQEPMLKKIENAKNKLTQQQLQESKSIIDTSTD